MYLVEKYQTVVVVGATGSGKTTQIPQYLHEAGWTQVRPPSLVPCLEYQLMTLIGVHREAVQWPAHSPGALLQPL